MTTTNQSFIEGVLITLAEDEATAGERWTVAETVRAMNQGFLWIAEKRPDALATYDASAAIAAGSRQTLPSGGFKLLDAPGLILADRRIMDAVLPGWRTATAATPTDYLYDERQPQVYWLYPPAAGSSTIPLLYAKHATAISAPAADAVPSAVSGNVPIDDELIPALRDYVLYVLKSKDADFAPGVVAAAQTHLQLATTALGVELQATVATSPRSPDAAVGRGVTTGA